MPNKSGCEGSTLSSIGAGSISERGRWVHAASLRPVHFVIYIIYIGAVLSTTEKAARPRKLGTSDDPTDDEHHRHASGHGFSQHRLDALPR